MESTSIRAGSSRRPHTTSASPSGESRTAALPRSMPTGSPARRPPASAGRRRRAPAARTPARPGGPAASPAGRSRRCPTFHQSGAPVSRSSSATARSPAARACSQSCRNLCSRARLNQDSDSHGSRSAARVSSAPASSYRPSPISVNARSVACRQEAEGRCRPLPKILTIPACQLRFPPASSVGVGWPSPPVHPLPRIQPRRRGRPLITHGLPSRGQGQTVPRDSTLAQRFHHLRAHSPAPVPEPQFLQRPERPAGPGFPDLLLVCVHGPHDPRGDRLLPVRIRPAAPRPRRPRRPPRSAVRRRRRAARSGAARPPGARRWPRPAPGRRGSAGRCRACSAAYSSTVSSGSESPSSRPPGLAERGKAPAEQHGVDCAGDTADRAATCSRPRVEDGEQGDRPPGRTARLGSGAQTEGSARRRHRGDAAGRPVPRAVWPSTPLPGHGSQASEPWNGRREARGLRTRGLARSGR